MNDNFAIQLFEGKKVRIVWDEEQEKYYFSVTDIVQVLTDQPTPRGASTYWAVLKKRLKEEGADELITNCKQLKLPAADGKKYKTDVADLEQIFRIIQSIPSKKAEPVKRWLAEVATTEYSRQSNPQTMAESRRIAQEGGSVASDARETMERRLGRSVVSPEKASDYIKPIEGQGSDTTPQLPNEE